LPEPENAVDEAVMKEEDRIEAGGVVFAPVGRKTLPRHAIIAIQLPLFGNERSYCGHRSDRD
jgi:hypothetical protein